MRRTNIEIDEEKLEWAKKAYNIKTTKDLVDFALSELLRAIDRKKILKMRGKVSFDLDLKTHRHGRTS